MISACVLALSACQTDEPVTPEPLRVTFQSIGLDEHIVNELELYQDKLYAATDRGLFMKDLATDADWVSLGLIQHNVKTIALLNNSLLAATSNPLQEAYGLFRSENGGQEWQAVSHNYGNGYPEPFNDLSYDADSHTLYASGWGVVAKSEDEGLHWTLIQGEWQTLATGLSFVRTNPANGDVWTGGQNAIETFVLARQEAGNGQWHHWQGLLPAPSVAKSIAFSQTDPQLVLIGGEDGIIRSNDQGASWSTIKEDHTARFYFGLDFDHTIKERVYAASWVKNFDNPQPLILYISEDAGNNWQEFQYPSSTLFGGVWSMVQRSSEAGKTSLYLGLYKGGVYEALINAAATQPE